MITSNVPRAAQHSIAPFGTAFGELHAVYILAPVALAGECHYRCTYLTAGASGGVLFVAHAAHTGESKSKSKKQEQEQEPHNT